MCSTGPTYRELSAFVITPSTHHEYYNPYDIGIQHTIGIKPDIHMIIVSTMGRNQVFAIQGRTIQKYKEKWMKCVDKYYEEFHNIPEIEMEVVDLDKLKG